MRLTETEIIERLQRQGELYTPLTIARFERGVWLAEGLRADAMIEFSIPDGPSFEALVEFKSIATPKTIAKTAQQLATVLGRSNNRNLIPMVIVPYMGPEQAKTLEREGISWIDLCGNMMIRVSNRVYMERTGKRNRFPDTAPIKKIFQGTSSLVSRALLLKPVGFSSQYELVDFINRSNANITTGTVSKVLKSLEEELLIEKTRTRISVSNAEKLLERLAKDYTSYTKLKETESYRFAPIERRGGSARLNVDQRNYLACGFYAAQIKGLAVTDQITIYVKDIEQASKRFDYYLVPDAEFGNLKFIETKDSAIWFNSTEVELTIVPGLQISMPVVDDIELYLEMVGATPRGPEIAKRLKWRILKRTDIDGQRNIPTVG